MPTGVLNIVPAIVRPAEALADLAGRINATHAAAEAAGRTFLERVQEVGRLLLEARAQLPHGQWLPWLAANVCFSDRQARKYMAVARGWPAIESEPGSDLTLAGALHRIAAAGRQSRRAQKLEELGAKAAAAPPLGPDRARVLEGDCLDVLPRLEAGGERFRLIFADPPYNQGVDYGSGPGADLLPESEFLEGLRQRFEAAARLLTADGSLWALIDVSHSADLVLMLRGFGLHQRAFITWFETFGVNCTRNFNRCSRHLLYFVRDPRRFVFHGEAVRRVSCRQQQGDGRADPWGKLWDDVWGINPPIPRLVDNDAERVPGFPTQLPPDLLRPIIGCASDPGDLVLDPFAGSATTGEVCLKLGRRFVGVEQTGDHAGTARLRLRVAAGAGATAR